jgi:type II secretion system protein J
MIKQGFTLIEILIALLAASIISIMSFDYLSNSVFLKERVEQSINLNNKHFNAINILRLDLMQSVPFQMKDNTGRDLNVSFIGGKDDQILKFITLNSSDTSNSYSKLRRVTYVYKDNTLSRQTTLVNKEDKILSNRLLLEDLDNLEFKYGQEPENLTNEWPNTTTAENMNAPEYILMEYTLGNNKYTHLFSTF